MLGTSRTFVLKSINGSNWKPVFVHIEMSSKKLNKNIAFINAKIGVIF